MASITKFTKIPITSKGRPPLGGYWPAARSSSSYQKPPSKSHYISSPLQAGQAAREEDFLLTRRKWLTQSGTGLGQAIPIAQSQ